MKTEALAKIMKHLEGNGCELVAAHQLQHPGDWYLQVVLARRVHDNTYVTWMHNSDYGGLFYGHYDMDLDKAKADFASRIPKRK